ncbi:transcriptional regulator, ArsR family [Xylanimonas cellulosilytica DSM 15894]|uniref:Transcriptional regulator, ArsR family n=1 Tax=Xylanimonas cellulosilytica (strain DSM 15894 / JCM 12276 / CECT 5975 / KCTC 9989 / LMG 20990 / NBRC 107835 / XIL07) TaxID=446471 RepID=D1BRT1_XYLCX|nr:metalloregulator ArsR/SmtB family transcription factor [Xylanimonas cellulosilytica]ACZ32347.1 transcriptional regulator, ArsR family [Xylanimonas cellulosilytica DSM 15894]
MTTLLPLIETPTDAPCCTPGAGGLDPERAATIARTFKALGDPTRIRLLSIIAAAPDGDACICDLTEPVGLSQPTVSHHMKLLAEAGLVTREQRGKWAHFAIAPDARGTIDAALDLALDLR